MHTCLRWIGTGAAALVLAPACGPKDNDTSEPSTGATMESSGSGTSPTTAATEDGSSSSGASTGATTGEPMVVECDGVTCSPGQLCLWPPSTCDYNEMPPEVKRGGKSCADFPAGCEDVAAEELAWCLSEALCDGSVTHEATKYEMGELDCFPAWNDCF